MSRSQLWYCKVGPGTGISPIMAFLQAREKALSQLRRQQGPLAALKPCLVYFGCRNSSEALYYEQLQDWVTSGVITGLHVAMSRQGPKVCSCFSCGVRTHSLVAGFGLVVVVMGDWCRCCRAVCIIEVHRPMLNLLSLWAYSVLDSCAASRHCGRNCGLKTTTTSRTIVKRRHAPARRLLPVTNLDFSHSFVRLTSKT